MSEINKQINLFVSVGSYSTISSVKCDMDDGQRQEYVVINSLLDDEIYIFRRK